MTGDLAGMRLQREMPRIEEVDFGIGQIDTRHASTRRVNQSMMATR